MRQPWFIVLLLAAACGGEESPEELKARADNAFLNQGELARAIELYQQAIGSGLADPELSSAWLNLTRCKVRNKDFDGALQGLARMHEALGDKMSPIPYCTIIADLLEQDARSQAVDVLSEGTKRFPDRIASFEVMIDRIRKLEPTPDELKMLEGISYL